MRYIASDFFARSPVLWLPLIALLLFMTVFVLSAIRAFSMKREDQDALASLPLEKELEHE